jgi:hypothetical protein
MPLMTLSTHRQRGELPRIDVAVRQSLPRGQNGFTYGTANATARDLGIV